MGVKLPHDMNDVHCSMETLTANEIGHEIYIKVKRGIIMKYAYYVELLQEEPKAWTTEIFVLWPERELVRIISKGPYLDRKNAVKFGSERTKQLNKSGKGK